MNLEPIRKLMGAEQCQVEESIAQSKRNKIKLKEILERLRNASTLDYKNNFDFSGRKIIAKRN